MMKHYSTIDSIWLLEQLNAYLADNKRRDYGNGAVYTTVEVHTVTYIGMHPGITGKEIARAMGKTKGAVSQILKKLSAEGLIRRQANASNAKKQHLYLTEKGEQLKQFHRAYDMEHGVPWLEFVMEGTTDLERDYVFSILERWMERMPLYGQEQAGDGDE